MTSDFEILKLITAKSTKVPAPLRSWESTLLKIIEWSFPDKISLKRRFNALSVEEKETILNRINFWRSKANLSHLKRTSDSKFQLEIAHLARLKAFHLSKQLAKQGTATQKKKWILNTLSSELFKTLSKKTFLIDECLDRILGLNERMVKSELFGKNLKLLYRNEDIYLELDPEDLFTPYRVLSDISQKLHLKEGAQLVDLGSGLGRVGIVLGLLNPKLKFLGIELMQERHKQALKAAKKLQLSHRIRFNCSDLSRTQIPPADYYYLFNPFSYLTLKRVYQELYRNAETNIIHVLMAQVGRPPRMVKRHPWLKQVYISPLDRNWRAHGFALYKSRVSLLN